jgi:hypothetical protein
MRTRLIEVRHTPKIAWPALVDDEGVRILLTPIEINDDGKRTGEKKLIETLKIPAIAEQMLNSRETIPSIYFHKNTAMFEFGWLVPWERWLKRGERAAFGDFDELTFRDCEDWVAACCHEFETEKPVNLTEMLDTSAHFCASLRGAALPAWVERRAQQMGEEGAALNRWSGALPHVGEGSAQEKLAEIVVEMARQGGHFAEA